MKARRDTISYQRDEGFRLTVEEYSVVRTHISLTLTKLLCGRMESSWQFNLAQSLAQWEDKGCRDVVSVTIPRDIAEQIAQPGAFSWLDKDETVD